MAKRIRSALLLVAFMSIVTADSFRASASAGESKGLPRASASAGESQEWRGMGRVSGKITDESGAPVEGAEVVATMGTGRFATKTNRKGEWALGGLGRGDWAIDFTKEGFEKRSISVGVSDSTRLPPIAIILKKAAAVVDPNAEIKVELEKASHLLKAGKHGDARAVYDALAIKYPEAYQLHALIARTYSADNQHDKAIEHLKIALAKQPDNVEWKLLLGSEQAAAGKADDAKATLASIDESKVTDATPYLNIGISLYNANQTKEAQAYFDKAVTMFPKDGDAYYYRGLTHLQLGNNDAAKADLTKFLELAPAAPEAETAKKILAQLK
jgi:tetratricopeptide (TPR) repeat protein